jgi:hypothetical protein
MFIPIFGSFEKPPEFQCFLNDLALVFKSGKNSFFLTF